MRQIEDSPRFGWRGMLLDCCRHFMTVDTVKRYIDLLAYHKMNVFHWHLTEDQGWRLEIKRYPAADRGRRLAGRSPTASSYGGFYTQDEVRDVVAYAAGPPRYGRTRRSRCRATPSPPSPPIPSFPAPASPSPSKPIGGFQRRPLPRQGIDLRGSSRMSWTRSASSSPRPIIHIGRREMPQALLEDLSRLPGPDQSRGSQGRERTPGLSQRAAFDRYMLGKGRHIIGWDEILEGGVSKTAVVQSWRGLKGAVAAAAQGNAVKSSPWDGTYFYCPPGPGGSARQFQDAELARPGLRLRPRPAGAQRGAGRARHGRRVLSVGRLHPGIRS